MDLLESNNCLHCEVYYKPPSAFGQSSMWIATNNTEILPNYCIAIWNFVTIDVIWLDNPKVRLYLPKFCLCYKNLIFSSESLVRVTKVQLELRKVLPHLWEFNSIFDNLQSWGTINCIYLTQVVFMKSSFIHKNNLNIHKSLTPSDNLHSIVLSICNCRNCSSTFHKSFSLLTVVCTFFNYTNHCGKLHWVLNLMNTNLI